MELETDLSIEGIQESYSSLTDLLQESRQRDPEADDTRLREFATTTAALVQLASDIRDTNEQNHKLLTELVASNMKKLPKNDRDLLWKLIAAASGTVTIARGVHDLAGQFDITQLVVPVSAPAKSKHHLPRSASAPPIPQTPSPFRGWHEFDTTRGVAVLRENENCLLICYGTPSLVTPDSGERCRDWNYPNPPAFSIIIPYRTTNVYANHKTSYTYLENNTPSYIASQFMERAPLIADRRTQGDAHYDIALLAVSAKGCNTVNVHFSNSDAMSKITETFRRGMADLKRKSSHS